MKKLNLPYKNYVFFSLLLSIAAIIFIVVFRRKLPLEVPLFYGAPEGETQLAPFWELTIPSVLSIVVTIVNAALASFLKDEFAKNALILSALVITLFSIVTTFKIIFLVGSF